MYVYHVVLSVVRCPSPSFLSSNCLIPDGAPLVPRGLGSLSESVGVRVRVRERRQEETRGGEEEDERRGEKRRMRVEGGLREGWVGGEMTLL